MKILVTGVDGFIGGAIYRAYQTAGAHVCGVSLQDSANKNVFTCDLTRKDSEQLILRQSPDVIIHCAAVIPDASALPSEKAAQVNQMIDRSVLSAARESGAKAIYFSSCSLYRDYPDVILHEELSVRTSDPYSQEKYESEQRFLELNHGSIAFRLSAPYGPGQTKRTVVRLFLENAIENRPLLLYSHGIRRQDFIYIDDIVQAVSMAVSHGGVSGVMNLASGTAASMRELAENVLEVVKGTKSCIQECTGREDPQKDYNPQIAVARAKEAIGFFTSHSLKEGLALYYQQMMLEKNRA